MEIVMSVDGLSEAEWGLWMEFPYGTHIDLRTGDPEQDDPEGARCWGPARQVRAEVLRDLLVGRQRIDAPQRNDEYAGSSAAVFLSGARITGRLDLRGIDFEPPLLLQECMFDEPLIITDSISRSVRLYRCHLPGIEGSWLKCAGDLHLRDCQIRGETDLSGAYVSGQLVLSGSRLLNPREVAVRADGLVVEGDLFCRDGAEVDGTFSLVGARIGGQVRLTNSTLSNPGGVALNAALITVEKDMYCREGFSTEGELSLSSGHVKGQLSFNSAKLNHAGKVALRADHLVVGGHMYCQEGFITQGELNLVAAQVGGEVRFSAAKLSNPGGIALHADRLDVADDMYCREGLEVDGLVSLRGAHVQGQLNFNHATLRNPGQVALYAEQLVVDTHLHCHDNFVARGEVNLVAARIGGEVRFSASTLRNPGGTALRADRMFVASDMYCRESLEIHGVVSLRGAHIAGQLNFNKAKIHGAQLRENESCETGPGRARKIGLDGDQLVVGSHLYCQDDFEIEGAVSLVAARIGGEVRFSGATLSHENEVALCAERLVVEKDMYCRHGLKINGAVSLRGAHVAGNLCFSTATISNPGGTAVQADQLVVGSDLCCDEGFTADGLIDLTDVHVGGELSLSGATLRNAGDVALLAPRLIVNEDMFCRDGFTAAGTVCLIGAHIGGKLSFTNAKLTGASLTEKQLRDTGISKMLTTPVAEDNEKIDEAPPAEGGSVGLWRTVLHGLRWLVLDKDPRPDPVSSSEEIVTGASGLALVADGLRIETDMTCDAGFTAHGEVRLKGARIGRNLDFSDATVENERLGDKSGTALNAEDVQADRMLMPATCKAGRISLRYGKMIELDDKRGVQSEQIHILGLSYERLIPPLDPETRLEWLAKNDYEPQPYDQLARSYLQLGHNDKARKVQLEAERRRRKETVAPIRKPWGWVQDVTIGYGYRAGRAAMLFVLVLTVGTLGFAVWPPPLMDPNSTAYFDPFFYTLDVLIPFADFGHRDTWDSTLGLELFKVGLAVCGWTLAVTAIAGINRALQRP
jgi:uncharacterized protein YjbI with pentapeptide repeats